MHLLWGGGQSISLMSYLSGPQPFLNHGLVHAWEGGTFPCAHGWAGWAHRWAGCAHVHVWFGGVCSRMGSRRLRVGGACLWTCGRGTHQCRWAGHECGWPCICELHAGEAGDFSPQTGPAKTTDWHWAMDQGLGTPVYLTVCLCTAENCSGSHKRALSKSAWASFKDSLSLSLSLSFTSLIRNKTASGQIILSYQVSHFLN